MREYLIWLGKILTIAVVLFFLAPLLLSSAGSMGGDGVEVAVGNDTNSVAVIEVKGPIYDSKDIVRELYRQAENDKIKGIVLRVDSPGGAVGPSQEIYSAVQSLKAKKPIVASMGAVAASGGLYVSLGASKIYAQPGTLTGSIGVLLQIPNFSKLANTVGVEMLTLKSGKLKDAGNAFRPMTEEERNFLQSTISAAYQEFVNAVTESRGIERAAVLAFADGRVLLGSQARDLHLVDEFGDIYDAARAIFDLRGESLKEGETPRLVYPLDRFEKFREVFESASHVSRLLTLSPRLEYMLNG